MGMVDGDYRRKMGEGVGNRESPSCFRWPWPCHGPKGWVSKNASQRTLLRETRETERGKQDPCQGPAIPPCFTYRGPPPGPTHRAAHPRPTATPPAQPGGHRRRAAPGGGRGRATPGGRSCASNLRASSPAGTGLALLCCSSNGRCFTASAVPTAEGGRVSGIFGRTFRNGLSLP
jgi:hypothetical protein